MGLLSILVGAIDPISRIADSIAKTKIAAANATTDRERIAAEERGKALERRMAVLVAESGSRINAMMRAALASPVAFLLWKVFIWDKALGQWTAGRTEQLSPELWQVVMAVIGFYFLYEAATGIARIVKR
jgi:hypothetical protein